MRKSLILILSVLLGASLAGSPKARAAETESPAREWTSTDGRKITATYLGIRKDDVALKLQNGKITFVPASRLSPEDNSFVRQNRFDFREAWQAWPPESMETMALVPVNADKGDSRYPAAFIYKTSHFRFIADVNLGTGLMKDLARVFELTYHLHSVSPLGTLAEPENNGAFDARLFGKTEDYKTAGGPESTAGVYLLKEKVFLAPLDLMGVREGSSGWRKDTSKIYDLSTIIHELTHMLTHGMLDNLPTWVNEGYAEYIANIPMERNGFMTGDDKIREGVLDTLISYSAGISGPRKARTGILSKADRINFTKQEEGPALFKVADVLTMNDVLWSTGSLTPPPPGTRPPPPRPPIRSPGSVPTGREPYLRLPRLYRTAHLIIYYFIQIEGETGVRKIRSFLEENQRNLSRYQQYVKDFKSYDSQMQEFLKLPDVIKLDDGRIQYPANLTPPVAPNAPFTDPDSLKLGGIGALLEGESASAVGARIEEALIKDLGVNLQFE